MGLLDLLPSGMLSASMGTSLLKGQIEKSLGFTIPWYHMHYNAMDNEVFFIIPVGEEKRKYPFPDGKKLCEVVKDQAAKKLTEGDTIDYLILKHSDKVEYELYFRDKLDNKQQLTGQL